MKAKLVRDRCRAVYDESAYVTACDSDSEYHQAMMLKMYEEVGEIALAPTDPEEYADLLEVMLAMAASQDVDGEDILQALISKRLAFGGFNDGMIWDGESDILHADHAPSHSQIAAKMFEAPFWIQHVLRRND